MLIFRNQLGQQNGQIGRTHKAYPTGKERVV
jgi:hypothetical protein